MKKSTWTCVVCLWRQPSRSLSAPWRVGLQRVLDYSRVLDSKNYSSNFLLVEYSLNSTYGYNFHFRFQFLQIKFDLLPFVQIWTLRFSYDVVLSPTLNSFKGRIDRHWRSLRYCFLNVSTDDLT